MAELVAASHAGDAVAVAKKKEQRYVCTACRANWYALVNDRCPSCKGACELTTVFVDESGVVHTDAERD